MGANCRTKLHLEIKIAQARMIVRPAAKRPVILAFRLGDRQIIDAGDAPPHQAVLVEVPVLIAVAAEPVAAVIAPFIGEADGNSIVPEGPQLLDEAVIELAIPFSPEKRFD